MKSEIDRQLTANKANNKGKYFIALTVEINSTDDAYNIVDFLQAESFTFDNIGRLDRFRIQIITASKPNFTLLKAYKIHFIKVSKLNQTKGA